MTQKFIDFMSKQVRKQKKKSRKKITLRNTG